MSRNAAIYYHPEGFTVSKDGKLMGRHVAGESFLRGYINHAGVDEFFCFAAEQKHFDDFGQRFAFSASAKRVWIPHASPERLDAAGAVFLPGPGLSRHAWHRRMFNQRGYSLTGVTHTIASDRVMNEIGLLHTAPVQPWDAVICTSQSVRTAYDVMLEWYGEYLASRLGCAVPKPVVQMPIIPLGVDAAAFERTGKREYEGKKLRKELGIANDDMVVLFVGRLSFHAKAHPYPMMAAAEKLSQKIGPTGRRVHLIQAGWFGNQGIEDAFRSSAKQDCPSVNAIFIDGRKPEIREYVWHAADIFCTLSDNIQETFGITPIEAMAAGIAVVASDWDGYRETVQNGVQGILVPTIMPAKGSAEAIAFRHAAEVDNYDTYLVKTSQSTAVDVNATAEAFIALAENADLRKQMGDAGVKHVAAHYDWSRIIPQYQALWQELAAIRASAPEVAPRKAGTQADPMRPDPFEWYAHYTTHQLNDQSVLAVETGATKERVLECIAAPFSRHAYDARPAEMVAIFELIRAQKEITIQQIKASQPSVPAYVVDLWLGWMVKFALVRFVR